MLYPSLSLFLSFSLFVVCFEIFPQSIRIRTINICISPDNIDTSQMSPERERVILPLPSPPPDLVEMMNTKYFRKFHFFCLSHSRGFSAFVSKVFLYRNSFYNIFNDLSHGAPTFSIVNQFNWTFT